MLEYDDDDDSFEDDDRRMYYMSESDWNREDYSEEYSDEDHLRYEIAFNNITNYKACLFTFSIY